MPDESEFVQQFREGPNLGGMNTNPLRDKGVVDRLTASGRRRVQTPGGRVLDDLLSNRAPSGSRAGGGMLDDTADFVRHVGARVPGALRERRRELELQAARDELPYIGTDVLGTPPEPGHPHGRPSFTGYRAGDEIRLLDRMSTEQFARLQVELQQYGFLKTFAPGKRDEDTIAGFEKLLTVGNREGKAWSAILYDYRELDEQGLLDEYLNSGDDTPKFTAPTYRAPDYATLADTVRGTMRDVLGRDPDDGEIAQLVGELQGWDREAYQADVAAAQSEFDAVQAGEAGSGEVASVDPLARFNESFRAKFKHEIGAIEQREEVEELQGLVQGGVSAISDMSRGV